MLQQLHAAGVCLADVCTVLLTHTLDAGCLPSLRFGWTLRFTSHMCSGITDHEVVLPCSSFATG
jgi:hypothetical protein